MEMTMVRAIGEHLKLVGYDVVIDSITKKLQDIKSVEGIDIVIFDPFYMKDNLGTIETFKRKHLSIGLLALNTLLLWEGIGEKIQAMKGAGIIIDCLEVPPTLEDIEKALAAA